MIFDSTYWMQKALSLARDASREGEIPVGALIVKNNLLIGKGYNQVEKLCDPTAHAEILAITSAAQYISNWRLEECTLYVTKEPCIMCAGALLNSRIQKVVFGIFDPREGAGGSKYDFMRDNPSQFVDITGGVMEHECKQLFEDFFTRMRTKNNEKSGLNRHDSNY